MADPENVNESDMEAFIERLKTRPELYEQFRRILDLSDPESGGHGLSIDRLESFLKPEIRKAGQAAISEFATHTEAKCTDTAKREQWRQREKKL